jgi:hypothetical protein
LKVGQRGGRRVVEGLASRAAQCAILVGDLGGIQLLLHSQHGLFGGLQQRIQTAQHDEGQDHVAVLAAHIDVTQPVVGDVPDEVGDPLELRLIHVLVLRCSGLAGGRVLGLKGTAYAPAESPLQAGSGSTELRKNQRPLGFAPGRWVSAEAATDFTAAGVLGLLNSFDAVEATRADVCSVGVFLVAKVSTFQVHVRRSSRRPVRRRTPAGARSGEQLHLTGMRTPVLTNVLPASIPEADVGPHKNVLPAGEGHANSS